ncbi:hypothetical protein ACOI1H_24315 [Loktanella sp. DJP18]|uniref:hypothetical protein n=1 Tax=Loktanella sp. DJP18 TaxID=3409788 RepID=UPI003BB6ECA0
MKKFVMPLALTAAFFGPAATAQAINFSQIDTNGDQVLQQEEIVAAFGDAGSAAVAALDTNNDGEVSLSEASDADRADTPSDRGVAASTAKGDNRSERGAAASEAKGGNRNDRAAAARQAGGEARGERGSAAGLGNRSERGNAASNAKGGNRD